MLCRDTARGWADRKGSPASVFLWLGTKASPGTGNQEFPSSLHWGCIPTMPYRAGSATHPCPELGGWIKQSVLLPLDPVPLRVGG